MLSVTVHSMYYIPDPRGKRIMNEPTKERTNKRVNA